MFSATKVLIDCRMDLDPDNQKRIALGKADRRHYLTNVYNRAVVFVDDDWENVIEYICSNCYIDDYLDEWISGVTEPEKIREAAKNWNREIYGWVENAMEEFSGLCKNIPDANGIADALEKLEPQWDRQPYGKSPECMIYDLKKAMEALNGDIYFGMDKVVMKPSEYGGYEYETILDEDTKRDILEHPENWAVIEIFWN